MRGCQATVVALPETDRAACLLLLQAYAGMMNGIAVVAKEASQVLEPAATPPLLDDGGRQVIIMSLQRQCYLVTRESGPVCSVSSAAVGDSTVNPWLLTPACRCWYALQAGHSTSVAAAGCQCACSFRCIERAGHWEFHAVTVLLNQAQDWQRTPGHLMCIPRVCE